MKIINKTSLAIAIGTLLVSGLLSTVSYAEDTTAAPIPEMSSPEASTPVAAPEAAAPAKKVKKHHKKAKAKKAPAPVEATPEAAPAVQ